MKKLVWVLAVLLSTQFAPAANILFMFSSTSQSVSTTLTNPYSLATAIINGTYEVNNSTYSGNPADFNTLLMTNVADFLALDSGGIQTMFEMDRIVMGNGNDVMNMASSTFSVSDTLIYGGLGNQLIWANAGNDEIHSGNGHSVIDGGPGTDTIFYPTAYSTFTINYLGSGNFTINANNSVILNDVSGVEFATFSDQTVNLATLVPEPSAISLLAITLAAIGMPGNRRR